MKLDAIGKQLISSTLEFVSRLLVAHVLAFPHHSHAKTLLQQAPWAAIA